MLRMVNKILLYLSISMIVLAGKQDVDINLTLKFPGASQKMIGQKMVVDLGYLIEGKQYGTIEIGSVDVRISQIKTAEDNDNCILKDLEFDSVNINKLKNFSSTIDSKDKVYIGKLDNRIILTARDIVIKETSGDVDPTIEELYFVSPECLKEQTFKGEALTSLSYTFKLYADIVGEIQKESIVGAFAQDAKGIEVSIKSLITEQIKNSNLKPYRRSK